MENLPIESTRNIRLKIILGIVGALALLPFRKFISLRKEKKAISCAPDKPETMKLLTQDGRLVEVEISKTSTTKEKLSNEQLMGWVKR